MSRKRKELTKAASFEEVIALGLAPIAEITRKKFARAGLVDPGVLWASHVVAPPHAMVILKLNENETVEGIATCGPKDVFDITKGLRIATLRAVDALLAQAQALEAQVRAAESLLAQNVIYYMDKDEV